MTNLSSKLIWDVLSCQASSPWLSLTGFPILNKWRVVVKVYWLMIELMSFSSTITHYHFIKLPCHRWNFQWYIRNYKEKVFKNVYLFLIIHSISSTVENMFCKLVSMGSHSHCSLPFIMQVLGPKCSFVISNAKYIML